MMSQQHEKGNPQWTRNGSSLKRRKQVEAGDKVRGAALLREAGALGDPPQGMVGAQVSRRAGVLRDEQDLLTPRATAGVPPSEAGTQRGQQSRKARTREMPGLGKHRREALLYPARVTGPGEAEYQFG